MALDTAATVRRSVAAALAHCADSGKVSPTMLRRMITMRNWIPNDDARFTLVAAIAAARRRGLEPASWDAPDIRQLATAGVDGSALGRSASSGIAAAHARTCSPSLCSSGSGVSDAWARSGVTAKDIRGAFGTAGATGQFAVAPDFIGKAVGHFLAVRHQTGTMPPFGLIRFLDALGLSEVRSEAISPISLLNAIEEGRAISPAAFKALLAKGGGLAKNYRFLQSWFEVGDTVNAMLTRNPGPGRQREALILAKVIEPRRQRWLQAAAWSAYISGRHGGMLVRTLRGGGGTGPRTPDGRNPIDVLGCPVNLRDVGGAGIDCPAARGLPVLRRVVHLKAAKRPPGGNSEDQKRDRWAEQKHGDYQQIAILEALIKGVDDQVNRPTHDPGGGCENPHAEQPPSPIQRNRFGCRRAKWTARNAVKRHHLGSPVEATQLASVSMPTGKFVNLDRIPVTHHHPRGRNGSYSPTAFSRSTRTQPLNRFTARRASNGPLVPPVR